MTEQCFVRDQDRNEWHGPFRSYAFASAWGELYIGRSDALPKIERRNWTVYTEREKAQVEACKAAQS